MTPEEVARSFVDAINSQRLDRLTELMTDDHVFIDSDGSEVSGRQRIREGWKNYSLTPRRSGSELMSRRNTGEMTRCPDLWVSDH